jgi:Ferritin-like
VVIDTRAELVNALTEAAEIEHGLLIQYLFGALSLKKRMDEGLTGVQQAALRDWERTILQVAVEEMGHFGTVCNLFSAIGETPSIARPNFPQSSGYYPFAFDLVPFSDDFLYRIQVAELPRGLPLPPPPGEDPQADMRLMAAVAPEPITYTYVGELYEKIAEGFRVIPEQDLFIGSSTPATQDDWSVNLGISPARDRGTAIAAINDIIEDGEGNPLNREGSHYDRFTKIRLDFFKQGRFAAARNVVRNPATRKHRDAAPGANVIENANTLEVAELFNISYACVLKLLMQYFALSGETAAQRQALKSAAARMMSTAIRPMAEILTELPFSEGDDERRAGPGFELYGPLTISAVANARWTIILEELDHVGRTAQKLAAYIPRLESIGETIGFVGRAIALAARDG